jgi:hypothetical protein
MRSKEGSGPLPPAMAYTIIAILILSLLSAIISGGKGELILAIIINKIGNVSYYFLKESIYYYILGIATFNTLPSPG